MGKSFLKRVKAQHAVAESITTLAHESVELLSKLIDLETKQSGAEAVLLVKELKDQLTEQNKFLEQAQMVTKMGRQCLNELKSIPRFMRSIMSLQMNRDLAVDGFEQTKLDGMMLNAKASESNLRAQNHAIQMRIKELEEK